MCSYVTLVNMGGVRVPALASFTSAEVPDLLLYAIGGYQCAMCQEKSDTCVPACEAVGLRVHQRRQSVLGHGKPTPCMGAKVHRRGHVYALSSVS